MQYTMLVILLVCLADACLSAPFAFGGSPFGFPFGGPKHEPMSSVYDWDLNQELVHKTYLGEWTANCMVVYARALAWLERDKQGSGRVRLIEYADVPSSVEYKSNDRYHYYLGYVRDIRPGKEQTLWCRPASTLYFSSHDNQIVNGTADGNYLPGKETVWMISFSQPTQVALLLKNINLEDSAGCRNDYISFYANGQDEKTASTFYCSKLNVDPPHSTFYNVTNFTIKFQTNENLEFSGFSGALVVVNSTSNPSMNYISKRSTRQVKKERVAEDEDVLQKGLEEGMEPLWNSTVTQSEIGVVDCVSKILQDGLEAVELLREVPSCEEPVANYLNYIAYRTI